MTERFDPENIDRLFRDGLSDYIETPHNHVWRSIRKDVPAQTSLAFFYWAAAAIVVLAFSGGMITQSMLSKHKDASSILIVKQAPVKLNGQDKNVGASNIAATAEALGTGNNKGEVGLALNASNHQTATHGKDGFYIDDLSALSKPVALNVEGGSDTANKTSSPLNDYIEKNNETSNKALAILPGVLDFTLANASLPEKSITLLNAHFGKSTEFHVPQPHKSFYVGTNCSFNHVNIIDHKNLNNSYQFQFIKTRGFSYGIQGGWNMTSHWGLETRLTIHSLQGQRYSYRVNEKYMPEREIQLDYYYFPLLVKYQTTLTPFANFVVMGGWEYGRYRTNDAFEYNQATSQLKHFRPDDIAGILATGIDVPLSRRIFLGLYANSSYGSNLGATSLVPGGSRAVPPIVANRQSSDDFSHPHNLIYGINLSVNYRY